MVALSPLLKALQGTYGSLYRLSNDTNLIGMTVLNHRIARHIIRIGKESYFE